MSGQEEVSSAAGLATTIANAGPCACGGCEGFSCPDAGGGIRGCVCGDKERYVRNVASGYWGTFHAPAHRVELTDELRSGSMGEYSQVYEPLEALSDKEFAAAVLACWNDYARGEGYV